MMIEDAIEGLDDANFYLIARSLSPGPVLIAAIESVRYKGEHECRVLDLNVIRSRYRPEDIDKLWLGTAIDDVRLDFPDIVMSHDVDDGPHAMKVVLTLDASAPGNCGRVHFEVYPELENAEKVRAVILGSIARQEFRWERIESHEDAAKR